LALDNFLRPVLSKKGADLSLLRILTGLIGGRWGLSGWLSGL